MTSFRPTLTRPTDVRNAWFIWLAVAAVICGIGIATNYERNVDGVYREATQKWLAGEDIYGDGKGGFLYLPHSALFFLSTQTYPEWVSATLWRLGSIGLFALGIFRISRAAGAASGVELFPFMTLLAIPISLAAFRNGQMTIAMTGLLVLAATAMITGRHWSATALLCVALAMKPLAIVMILLALVLQRSMWWRIPIGLACLVPLPYLFQSPAFVTETYGLFLGKLLEAGTPGSDVAFSDVFGIVRVFGTDAPETIKTAARLLAAVGTLAACWLGLRRFGHRDGTITMLIMTLLYLLLFNPRTENNTYAMLAPALALLTASAFLVTRRWLLGGLLVAANVLILANFELTRHLTPGRETWLPPLVTLLITIWFVSTIVRGQCPWRSAPTGEAPGKSVDA